MNADKVVLVVCGADAAGYVAIVGQGFVQVVGNHRVLIGRAVLLGCQLTVDLLECRSSIIIIGIDDCERCAVDGFCRTENRMTGSPRFDAAFRHFVAFRENVEFLVNILYIHVFLNSLADALAECLVDGFFDDKDDFLKTCLFCIINGKVDNHISVRVNWINLF